MKANEATIEKIANAAIEIMVRRANIEMTGTYQRQVVGKAEICEAIASDPTGNVAFRFAEMLVLGLEHYEVMA